VQSFQALNLVLGYIVATDGRFLCGINSPKGSCCKFTVSFDPFSEFLKVERGSSLVGETDANLNEFQFFTLPYFTDRTYFFLLPQLLSKFNYIYCFFFLYYYFFLKSSNSDSCINEGKVILLVTITKQASGQICVTDDAVNNCNL
jgi:hypothetical protein